MLIPKSPYAMGGSGTYWECEAFVLTRKSQTIILITETYHLVAWVLSQYLVRLHQS